MKRPSLAWMLGGFAIWSLAFVTLYGLHGIGCAHGWDAVSIGPTSLQRLVQVALWLAFLPPHIALALEHFHIARNLLGIPFDSGV